MGEYTVHLVGESNYQPAIRKADEGDAVQLIPEPDNPYDQNAVRVADTAGRTLGYIERGHWLQRVLHHEKTACEAHIRHIMGGEKGKPSLGVVLTVWTGVDAAADLRKSRKSAPVHPRPEAPRPAPATSPSQASGGLPPAAIAMLIGVAVIFLLAILTN